METVDTGAVNADNGVKPAQPTSDPASETVPDRTPHEMRIASQGKMRTYVTFALKFLQEPHERPLVLHTLPYKPPPSLNDDVAVTGKTVAPPVLPHAAVPETTDASPSAQPRPKSSKQQEERKSLPSTCACIPRLISVVEIIKREWVELMSKVENGKSLYQYNELGSLEELEGKAEVTVEKKIELLDLLQGKNHLQIRRTPYMKITLCKIPIEDGIQKATYQEPLPGKKRSKSAKARARKKRKQEEATIAGAAKGRLPAGKHADAGGESDDNDGEENEDVDQTGGQ